jgi:hypothetical protein
MKQILRELDKKDTKIVINETERKLLQKRLNLNKIVNGVNGFKKEGKPKWKNESKRCTSKEKEKDERLGQ